MRPTTSRTRRRTPACCNSRSAPHRRQESQFLLACSSAFQFAWSPRTTQSIGGGRSGLMRVRSATRPMLGRVALPLRYRDEHLMSMPARLPLPERWTRERVRALRDQSTDGTGTNWSAARCRDTGAERGASRGGRAAVARPSARTSNGTDWGSRGSRRAMSISTPKRPRSPTSSSFLWTKSIDIEAANP